MKYIVTSCNEEVLVTDDRRTAEDEWFRQCRIVNRRADWLENHGLSDTLGCEVAEDGVLLHWHIR